MKNIKAIALDLDGTLLDDDKKISSYSFGILKECISRGIEVIVVTGRAYSVIPKEILDLEGIHYAITCNGARILKIKHTEIPEVLYQSLLSVKIAEKLIEAGAPFQAVPEIIIDGISYIGEEVLKDIHRYFSDIQTAEYILKTRKPASNVLEMLKKENKELDKLQFFFQDEEDRQKALIKFQKMLDIEATSSISNNIEIGCLGTNKGNALELFMPSLGIPMQEVMAFGDGFNDVEMIQKSGIGIAMKNGKQEVKEVAKYITKEDNNNDGVCRTIETFLAK